MFSLEDLSRQIEIHRDRQISSAAFEDWFRRSSWGWYDRKGDSLSDAIAAVDAILTEYDSGEIPDIDLAAELATAFSPFVGPARVYARTVSLSHGNPSFRASVATPSLRLYRELASA
jgi:hypothetical protein